MEKKGTRRIDELGRVVIPMDIRRSLNIKEGEYIEFFVDYSKNSIIIKKYSNSCIICGSCDNLVDFNDKTICKECINNISNLR